MKIIEPSVRVLAASGHDELPYNYDNWQLLAEYAGRICWNSQHRTTLDSAVPFLNKLWSKSHRSVWEHSWGKRKIETGQFTYVWVIGNVRAQREYPLHGFKYLTIIKPDNPIPAPEELAASFEIVCDRGVSHELVRHRPFAYSQRSTRYCAEKPGEMEFIRPCWIEHELELKVWQAYMESAESAYNYMAKQFTWRPEQARSVLPNSLATRLVMTGSIKDWQHFCELRCAKTAHPQMRQIAEPIRDELKRLFSEHF